MILAANESKADVRHRRIRRLGDVQADHALGDRGDVALGSTGAAGEQRGNQSQEEANDRRDGSEFHGS